MAETLHPLKSQTNNTPEEAAKAARTIIKHAKNPTEAVYFLNALGLYTTPKNITLRFRG